jgi:hypothetical protein
MSRRERLAGFRYQVGSIVAEVRKACRDELKILYSGGPFDDAAWDRLRTLGESSVFEASRLNPKMKDLVRIKAEGFRVEGARGGELVVAFYAPGHRARSRKRVEALLAGVARAG